MLVKFLFHIHSNKGGSPNGTILNWFEGFSKRWGIWKGTPTRNFQTVYHIYPVRWKSPKGNHANILHPKKNQKNWISWSCYCCSFPGKSCTLAPTHLPLPVALGQARALPAWLTYQPTIWMHFAPTSNVRWYHRNPFWFGTISRSFYIKIQTSWNQSNMESRV